MSTSSRVPLTLILALAGCLTAEAEAGFVDGVERFGGTELDTAAWQTRTANGPVQFSQEDALTIDSRGTPDSSPIGDYLTRVQTVPVGGSVRVDVRVNAFRLLENGISPVELDLILPGTDRTGYSFITRYSDLPEFQGNGVQGTFADGTAGAGTHVAGQFGNDLLGGREQPIGSTFVYQIERLSATRVRFGLFDAAAGTPSPVAFTTRDFGEEHAISDDLLIQLRTQELSATFDNVTVNRPLSVAPVPLPPAAWPGLAVLGGMALRQVLSRQTYSRP